MRDRSANGRHAFTLIELIAVIAILGLLATVASLSLGGAMDRYQLTRAAETFQRFDARARREASLSREPMEAVIPEGQRPLIVRASAQARPKHVARYRLPKTVAISETRIRRKVVSGDETIIPFRHGGCSPTYAVQLRRGDTTRWLVVLGISGQVIPVNSEEQVDALLAL